MPDESERIVERLIEEGRVVKSVTVDESPRPVSLTHVNYLKGKYPVVVLTDTDLKDGEPVVYWKRDDGTIALRRVEPTNNPYKYKTVREEMAPSFDDSRLQDVMSALTKDKQGQK